MFKAECPKSLKDRQSPYLVRLEAGNENSQTVTRIAALQQIVTTIIPENFPQTFQVREAKNAQGRIFHFSVIELVEGDILEDVWQQMSGEGQIFAVAGLLEAPEMLHSIRPSDKGVNEILSKTLREEDDEVLKSFEQPGVFEGPHPGFLRDGPALLGSLMERRKLKKPF